MAARQVMRRRHAEKSPVRSVRIWLTDPSGFGVSLFGVLVVAVIVDAALSPGALTPRDLSLADAGLVILRDVAASAVAVLIVRFFGRLWLDRTFSRRHPSVTVTTVFAAFLGSLLLLEGLFGVHDILGDPQATVLRTAVWLTAVALVGVTAVNAGRQHLTVMAAYRQSSAALEATLMASENLVKGERSRAYERIAQAFGQMVADARSVRGVSRELQVLADDVLRPLSRALASDASTFQPVDVLQMPKPRLAERFAHLLTRPLIQPGVLSATVLLLTFRQTLRAPDLGSAQPATGVTPPAAGLGVSADWESALVSLLTLVVVTASVYVSAFVLSRIYAVVLPVVSVLLRWLLAVGSVIVVSGAALGTLGLVYAIPGLDDTPPPLSAGVLAGIVLPLGLVMTVSTVLQALFRLLDQNEERIATYNQRLRDHVARTNAQLIHERRDIARRVHNSVQAAVNAARLTLDRIAEPDPEVFAQVTGRIADAVEQLLADVPAKGLTAQLDGLDALWSGVCAVTWTLDEVAGTHLDTDAVVASLVGDIIHEGCANAVVHGTATRVAVTVENDASGTAVRVTVRDNGRLKRQVTQGTGSQILTAVCTSWELSRDGDETVLTAVLPFG